MRSPIWCLLALLAGWTMAGSPLAAQSVPGLVAGEELLDEAERPEERAGEDRIETDRDSFTPATTTAGRGRFILESAYSFIDNKSIPETHSFPELILRGGLTKRLEWRLGWNYEVGGAGNDVSGNQADTSPVEAGTGSELVREQRLVYGFKFGATEQQEWVPASALMVQGYTPTGGAATATQVIGTYVFGWELPHGWKADFSLRYGTASEEGDRFGVWAPSAVLRVPLGARWNVHAEYFGLYSQDRAGDFVRHYFSPGVHYLVTTNLEVGVRVGWGLNDQTSRCFANVGFGLRF